MKWGQVLWPILRKCVLHLTHPSAHTHTPWIHTRSNEHTHTAVNTHTHWTHTHTHCEHTPGAFMLWHPGSSWEIGALLKGLTSVVVLRMEESTGYSPTIPAGPETWTRNLLGTSLTLKPLGHNCPIWYLYKIFLNVVSNSFRRTSNLPTYTAMQNSPVASFLELLPLPVH